MFSTLANEVDCNSVLGPEVPRSLAQLADKLLKSKIDPTNKDKYDKYRRPSNVEFLSSPPVNKPVWGNMSHSSKMLDNSLQTIQRDFLSSSIPVLKVMEQLNAAKDNLNTLDVTELIRTLSDSLSFIGTANVGMVQKRRSLVKQELPPSMHLLCQDSVEFSGSNLFGNCLSSDIKEISELNKISSQLRGRGRGISFRGRGTNLLRGFRSRGIQKRGFRGRLSRRFPPVQPRAFKKAPLNRDRPSN